MSGFAPLTPQGSLNRVLTHIVVPTYAQLSVSASFMSKALSNLTFDGPFVQQPATATGIVNSPEPFVMAQVEINLLRSQSLIQLWTAQLQLQCNIGPVAVYSDSTQFPVIMLDDCSITNVVPGAFDGVDPTTKVEVRGVYYVNSALWAGL